MVILTGSSRRDPQRRPLCIICQYSVIILNSSLRDDRECGGNGTWPIDACFVKKRVYSKTQSGLGNSRIRLYLG